MLLNKKSFLVAAAACTILSSPAFAGGEPAVAGSGEKASPTATSTVGSTPVGDSLSQAILGGKGYVNARYRYENVDQDGFSKDARASTLRTNVGYKTASYKGFSGVIELQNVTVVGDDDYNDTVNGNAIYPVVADPASTEVNEAYLSFSGAPDTTVNVGRQKVNLDNQRFVGTVGWRQNDQTFDSVVLVNSSIPNTTLIYGYVDNVNRVFGDDHPLGNLGTQTHLINATYDISGLEKITAYGYILDIDEVASLSSKTFGLRVDGAKKVGHVKALYEAEYAVQSDNADNTADYNASYIHAMIGAVCEKTGFTAKIGYEKLEGDSSGAFQTPLATLHKFNGWADKFLSTPTNGLEDIYGTIAYKVSGSTLNGTKAAVTYHDFSAETGSADYGTEWDAVVSVPFAEHYSAAIHYADYGTDGFSVDTQKFWLTLQAKF